MVSVGIVDILGCPATCATFTDRGLELSGWKDGEHKVLIITQAEIARYFAEVDGPNPWVKAPVGLDPQMELFGGQDGNED